MKPSFYHLGIRGHVARSNLGDANEKRDWRIYRDFANTLIAQARRLYADDAFAVDLDNSVYALDTTTIDLSLKVFPWAHFRTTKAAVKMHTQIDLRGNIPSFIHVSDGKMHEVNVLDLMTPEGGSFTIMDRGFLDFARLYRLTQAGAFFVIRPKSNTAFQRVYSRSVDKTTGLRCDQTVRLTGVTSANDYPQYLRYVVFYDEENDKRLGFFTNNFELPALTIAQLYKCRWQVGVSSEGHAVMSVKVRPEPKDSGSEAREALWRESKTAEPSDNILERSMREASGCNVQ